MKPPSLRSRASRVPASTVNPAAGSYPITADPDERAASDAAAQATWEAFPYYERRYGDRGWRFTLSDSGWIATLCSLPPKLAEEKVAWLQRLLATRGMPSYLLERHLGTIAAELTKRIPDDAERHEVLAFGARFLRDQRVAVLDASAFDAAAGEFDAGVRSLEGAVPAMGAVLASAVIDDALGVADESSVFEWALDAQRFGPEWIDAVKRFRKRFRATLADRPRASKTPAV
jgi:hypothetical protein